MKRSYSLSSVARPALKRSRAVSFSASALKMARAALYQVKKFKSEPEVKFLETADSHTPVDATWTIFASDLINIAQGDTQTSRTGNKVMLKDIEVRGNIFPVATLADAANQHIRLVLLWWASDTNPSVPDPFLGSTALSFLDPTFKDKVKILWDKSFIINARPNAIASPEAHTFSYKRKIGLPMRFDGTGAVAGETGNLLFMSISDDNGGTTGALVQTNCKVNFTDM